MLYKLNRKAAGLFLLSVCKMDRKEPSHTFSLWILVFVFFVSSPPEAQAVVMASPRLISSAPGDDVVLRCHLEPPVDIQALTVEWSKPDLQPDPWDPLRRVQYVHVHRNGGEVTDMKLRSYAGRTELLTEQLRHGNVSLKILNVTLADAARYRCFIPKLKSAVREATVQLVVDPYLIKPSTTETPLDPRNLTTQEPQDQTNAAAGGRSSLGILAASFCVLELLGGVCLWRHYKKNSLKDDSRRTRDPA
ncbi:myelin-oligodendrocyte glycoprotein-like isoform X1 [Betta splendens]|uniref:Myelin-oligodendrocyte glycoprotein-like isoform X1 n=1 Tax=Betta splendens TaxID=158456 RepID=A0A6P7P928_BETSP|nr:myelin-oligodendrocyte glycoprotein-like isoform X1 [Betta splendens]